MSETRIAPSPVASRTIPLTDFSNVAAGRTAKLTTRLGYLFHDLQIKFAGVTLAQLKSIRVKANDEILYRAPATFFDVLNYYENAADATASGVIQIPFSRRDLADLSAEVLTGINLGDPDPVTKNIIAQLDVEFDIDAAAAAPVLTAFARVSNPMIGAGPGYVRRLFDSTLTGVGVGRRDITDLAPIGVKSAQRMFLNRVFLQIAPASLNFARTMVNRREESFVDPKVNEYIQKQNRRNPVAGWTILDTSQEGLGRNFYRIFDQNLEEFRLELDVNTAPAGGTLNYIAEYIGAYQ